MKLSSRLSYIAVIGGCALGASATPAAAYVDPGSGSLVIQLVLGGVASIAVLLKHYWRRIAAMFRPATESSAAPGAVTKPDDGER